MKALITIITPVYNAEETIVGTIHSIREQTLRHWHCLLVNDGSTDHSLQLIKEMVGQDRRFTLINNPSNLKLAASLNIGIRAAQSDYIMQLDADDLIAPNCLEERFKHITGHNCGAYIFPNYNTFYRQPGDGATISFREGERNALLKHFLLHKLPLPWNTSAIVWKRSTLLQLQGYNEELERMVDAELSIKLLLTDIQIAILDNKPDFYYRKTTSGSNTDTKRLSFVRSADTVVESVLEFTGQQAPGKLTMVQTYLGKFIWHVAAITLVSTQFSRKDTLSLMALATTHGLWAKKKIEPSFLAIMANSLCYPAFKWWGIRSLVWRLLNINYH